MNPHWLAVLTTSSTLPRYSESGCSFPSFRVALRSWMVVAMSVLPLSAALS